MECTTCILIGLMVVFVAIWYYLSVRKLPPGPRNFFGQMFKPDSKATAEYILDLKKKYGAVSCIRVFGTPCIYLNTHEKIRQCFVNLGDATSGRMSFTGVKHRLTTGRALVFNDGESWQEHRRFALSTLRDFGFGKGGAEQIVQNELAELVEELEKSGGGGGGGDSAVDPQFALNMATCNVISSLIFGERCGSEAGFKPIYNVLQANFRGNVGMKHELSLYYLLRMGTLLPWSKMAKQTLKNFDVICDYIETKIDYHEKTFNGEIRDVLDAYLQELQDKKNVGAKKHFNKDNLERMILDLFIGGMETTSSTVRWALYLMARHPFVQQRVQAELDEVLEGRVPSTADRKRLAYVDAVVMEVQRYATIAPVGAVPHRVTEQFSLDGYTIPKDALLFANLFAAHRDTSVWEDAFGFNPENFYDAATKSTRNAELLIPFGVGRRSCLGESLAKQELFVFFSGLMQAFEVRPASDERFPTEDECQFGRLRMAPHFKVTMKRRAAAKK